MSALDLLELPRRVVLWTGPRDIECPWRCNCAVPIAPDAADRFPHHCLRCNRVIAPPRRAAADPGEPEAAA